MAKIDSQVGIFMEDKPDNTELVNMDDLHSNTKINKIPFIDGIHIKLKIIPPYPEFKGRFKINIDKELCKIIDNYADFHPSVKTLFRNTVMANISNNGNLYIKHNQRYKLGRFYANGDISLIPHARQLKHTIMQYGGWSDLDQVKGHCTIAVELFKDILPLPNIKHYINNFDDVANKLIMYHSTPENPLNTGDIKYLFNLMIYGGTFNTWMKKITTNDDLKGYIGKEIIMKDAPHDFVINFMNECKAMTKLIVLHNPDLVKIVRKETEWKTNSSTTSYFFQIVENHILYITYQFMVEKGIIKPKECELEYDGLCFPPTIEYNKDDLITELNQYIVDTTGLNIKYKFKGYEESAMQELIDQRDLLDVLSKTDNDETDGEDMEKTLTLREYVPYEFGTDVGMYDFLIENHKDKFIWIRGKDSVKGDLYCWKETECCWENGDLEFIRFISRDGIDMLDKIRYKAGNDAKVSVELLQQIYGYTESAIKTLHTLNKVKDIIKVSEAFLTRRDIQFDANPDLFGCNNGVYDLIKHEFRKAKPTDYVSMTCGYDYNPVIDPVKMAELRNILASIIPNEENRRLLLEILSAGLTGRVVEKFVLLNGRGRNGKGLIIEFCEILFGDYGLIYGNTAILTEDEKTGGNPEKAKLHRKRIVGFKEPDAEKQLLNSNIKSLTGGGNVSGRMLYSNNTNIVLCMIMIMECNDKPKFKSQTGDAEGERVVDLLFPNKFTSKPDEVNGVNVFMQNPEYKTIEWKESHRDAFLQILIESYKSLQANNHILTIPQNVEDRTTIYLNESLPIITIFNEKYVKTGNNNDILKLKEVFNYLKTSNAYYDLPKVSQRKCTYNSMCDIMKKNAVFRSAYKERHNGLRNILIGYKLIDEDIETPTKGVLDYDIDDLEEDVVGF